jgi:prepilin-type N-terminal cleavage/methylation domain-containing protein
MSSRRGFSLIEVIVALTIAAILMSAALITFTGGKYTVQESARRAQMARDAQLVLDLLGKDISALGAGVPAGTCLNGCSSTTDQLTPALRRATSDGLVFLGDAPFPNAELPGVATLARLHGDADSNRVALTAEVTGPCTPPATSASNAFQCTTSTTTPLAGTFAAADDCKESQPNARTCPWAMNKWQASNGAPVHLTFVEATGSFFQRQWNGTTATINNAAGTATHFGIEVQAESGGAATLTRNLFYDPIGSGYVVNIDRILWSVEDASGGTCDSGDTCTVRRRQCWGHNDSPTSADFPSASNAAFTSSSTPRNCTAPADGTGWETIVEGVDGVTDFNIEYFGANGASLGSAVAVANLATVRSLVVTMTLQDRVGQGPILKHTVNQRFFVPNRELQ